MWSMHPRVKLSAMTLKTDMPSSRIDVSVLIPAWNAEHTLAKAIRSALNQCDISVEVIVCDNGSSDFTLAEAARFPVEKFRFDVNRGFVGAMNALGDRAKGRWMIPLGADDWYEPNSLTEMVRRLDAAQGAIDFAYGCQRFHGRRSDIYVPKPYTADEFYDHNAGNYAVMWSRQLWLDGLRYGSEIEPSVGVPDWDFTLQMIERGAVGIAFSDLLVVNWIYAYGSNTDKTWAKADASLAELKRRHPKVRAERI